VWSALVLAAIALASVWFGGYAFLLGVAAGCVIVAREWVGMTGYSATSVALWFPVALLATTLAAAGDHPGGGLVMILAGTLVFALWAHLAAQADADEPTARPAADAAIAPAANASIEPAADAAIAPAAGAGIAPATDAATVSADADIVPAHAAIAPTTDAVISPANAAITPSDAVTTPAGAATRTRRPLSLALGFPYIGLAAIALPWLRDDHTSGLANILFVLAIVWGSDIGAYVVGRIVGGPKLAPAISPGKTWSGAAGGLASAVLAALGIAACLSSGYSPSHVMELAIGLGIVSQAGDLLESALKRRFGVKDSGHLIPGHGGLLDRLDALLAVAPVAAALAYTVGRGEVLWH